MADLLKYTTVHNINDISQPLDPLFFRAPISHYKNPPLSRAPVVSKPSLPPVNSLAAPGWNPGGSVCSSGDSRKISVKKIIRLLKSAGAARTEGVSHGIQGRGLPRSWEMESRDSWSWGKDSRESQGHGNPGPREFEDLHRKKKVCEFPVPSRDVTTKLSLGGNYDVITELLLPRGSLVSDIPAGDGKLVNLFLRCMERSQGNTGSWAKSRGRPGQEKKGVTGSGSGK